MEVIFKYLKETVFENTDRIWKEVDISVMAVKNQVHDVVLTTLDNVVIPKIELAVRSVTGSSKRGPNSVVKNPD